MAPQKLSKDVRRRLEAAGHPGIQSPDDETPIRLTEPIRSGPVDAQALLDRIRRQREEIGPIDMSDETIRGVAGRRPSLNVVDQLRDYVQVSGDAEGKLRSHCCFESSALIVGVTLSRRYFDRRLFPQKPYLPPADGWAKVSRSTSLPLISTTSVTEPCCFGANANASHWRTPLP